MTVPDVRPVWLLILSSGCDGPPEVLGLGGPPFHCRFLFQLVEVAGTGVSQEREARRGGPARRRGPGPRAGARAAAARLVGRGGSAGRRGRTAVAVGVWAPTVARGARGRRAAAPMR